MKHDFWCSECRRRQPIVEEFDASDWEGGREIDYWVRRLSCGHQMARRTGREWGIMNGTTVQVAGRPTW